MYIRYYVDYSSPKTNQPFGLFVATWHLVRDKRMTKEEEEQYWLEREKSEQLLPVPPFYEDGNTIGATTWFKRGEKTEALLEEFKFFFNILEKYGVKLYKATSENPGKIIYEDAYQIGVIAYKAGEK